MAVNVALGMCYQYCNAAVVLSFNPSVPSGSKLGNRKPTNVPSGGVTSAGLQETHF